MKTQSPDTSLDAELVLVGMIRTAPLSKRFAFVEAWTASMLEAGNQYVRQQYPQASDEEVKLLFIERQYGKELADELRHALHMYGIKVADTPDHLKAIYSLVKICEDLNIPYALSGSLASSLYGFQRATLQIDFIADLRQKHFPSFCAQLSGLYLLHEEEIEAAIRQKSCFRLVHLESLFKVKVTLPGMVTMGQQVFQGMRKIALIEGEHSVPVLSTEQMILLLLEDFKRSDERADDLWYDLLGMMKVQSTNLDMAFLTQQAALPGVTELLARALIDAGLRDA